MGNLEQSISFWHGKRERERERESINQNFMTMRTAHLLQVTGLCNFSFKDQTTVQIDNLRDADIDG